MERPVGYTTLKETMRNLESIKPANHLKRKG
jgi:hypothetical protein